MNSKNVLTNEKSPNAFENIFCLFIDNMIIMGVKMRVELKMGLLMIFRLKILFNDWLHFKTIEWLFFYMNCSDMSLQIVVLSK